MKISTGEIKFQNELIRHTNPVIGEIIKIRVHNDPDKKNSDLLHLTIRTVEGEVLIQREIGNKEWVFYPKNLSAATQGINIEASDQPTVNTNNVSDNYFSNDPLIIELKNGGINPKQKTYLRNIVIFVRQTYGDFMETRARPV